MNRLLLLGSLRGNLLLGLISASKLPHKRITAIVGEVNAADVRIVEGASASSTFVLSVFSGSTIEVACAASMSTTAAATRELGALIGSLLCL